MKFKITVLLAIIGFSMLANAKTASISRFQKASLNVCPAQILGCAHSIEIGGKTFPVEVDPSASRASRLYERMIAIHQLLELPNTNPFLARGYFVFKGTFPNPTFEQLVFVLTDVEGVVMPKALD